MYYQLNQVRINYIYINLLAINKSIKSLKIQKQLNNLIIKDQILGGRRDKIKGKMSQNSTVIDLEDCISKAERSDGVVKVHCHYKSIEILKFKNRDKSRCYELNTISINMRRCAFQDKDMKRLSRFFKKIKHCKQLILDFLSNYVDLTPLVHSFQEIENVEELKIAYRFIQQDKNFEGILSLFDSLSRFTQLSHLTLLLQSLLLRDSAIAHLSTNLKKIKDQLISLNLTLDSNPLTEYGAIELSSAIQQMKQLKSIQLSISTSEGFSNKVQSQIYNAIFSSSQDLESVYVQMVVKQKKTSNNNETDLLVQNNCKQIKRIELDFQDSDLQFLFKTVDLPIIESLVLKFPFTELSNSAFQDLSQIIQRCRVSDQFKVLKLETSCGLPHQEMQELSYQISQCRHLEVVEIDIKNNSFQHDYEYILTKQHLLNLNLQKLIITVVQNFSQTSLDNLSNLLSSQINIKQISVSLLQYKQQTDDLAIQSDLHLDYSSLFSSISQLQNLTNLQLTLNDFQITDELGIIVGENISQIKCLQILELNLSHNSLHSQGIDQLLYHLSKLPLLKSMKIKLNDNPAILDEDSTKNLKKFESLQNLFIISVVENGLDDNVNSDYFTGIIRNINHMKKLICLQINYFESTPPTDTAIHTIYKMKHLIKFSLYT